MPDNTIFRPGPIIRKIVIEVNVHGQVKVEAVQQSGRLDFVKAPMHPLELASVLSQLVASTVQGLAVAQSKPLGGADATKTDS